MPLLFLLACFSSVLPSRFEARFAFRWDAHLRACVDSVYGITDNRALDRLAQLYCESAFNPRAVSDYGGWKKAKLDTLTALLTGKGAGGLAQFIWQTAKRYGADSVQMLFDPLWSIKAECRYMKGISRYLATTRNPKARRALMIDRKFGELCATAGYNTGEGRIRDRLNRYGANWQSIGSSILPEPRLYAEKIALVSTQMRLEARWRALL